MAADPEIVVAVQARTIPHECKNETARKLAKSASEAGDNVYENLRAQGPSFSMNDGEYSTQIVYCPFCGEKLCNI